MTRMFTDPIAPASAQFGLSRGTGAPAVTGDSPSPHGVRPWGLRGMRAVSRTGLPVPAFRYCHEQQLAVTEDGVPLIDTRMADPTAHSVTNLDGDEGPNEDWKYDFAPDALPE